MSIWRLFLTRVGGTRGSVALDVVVLDDLEPALLFAGLKGREFLGSAGEDLHLDLLGELLRDVRGARRLGELDAHAVDDRTRRAGRHIDAPPRVGRIGLEALLGERRNVRQARRALVAGGRERPQL